MRARLPAGGFFAGLDWLLAPEPFALPPRLAGELESLGRVLHQFNRAVNLLYRQSVSGRQPAWVAAWLDQGKPADLVELQRATALKNELPRVLRPDLLLTETGFSITELDSVPGGIGLTAWLNESYAALAQSSGTSSPEAAPLLGGADGMKTGFAGIFGEAERVHIIVSAEAHTYRPEMEWLCERLGERFQVRAPDFAGVKPGDAVYRFFELFDLAQVPASRELFALAREKKIRLTPPPRPIFEEKMLFALLWNRHLRGFWRQELGEAFFDRMRAMTPYTWLMDPSPLPPHAAIPELGLTDWQQLKLLSQRERELILKVSGFSETAWGARGVYLGSDLSTEAWSQAVDMALRSFPVSPFVLQRYHKPRLVHARWLDPESGAVRSLEGRVRLCPYYFVHGEGDAARPKLGGVLATICPADKKIIHGMKDAILAPCAAMTDSPSGSRQSPPSSSTPSPSVASHLG